MRNHSQRRRNRLNREGACVARQAGPQAGGREEQGDEAGFQQHAVRLVAGKILRRRDEGEKANQADGQRAARPQIQDDSHGSEQAEPAEQHQGVIP